MSLALVCALVASLSGPSTALAQDRWPSLAADRTAARVGDSLTVVIVEASSAATTAQSGSRRDTRLAGSIGAAGRPAEGGALGLQGQFDGRGQMNRSGRLIGQIGVTVQEVLPNGDLKVSGGQSLEIDGEATTIRLTGRVRPADILGDNTIASSRIAEAQIIYDGEGPLARSGRPGPLNRILSWFGL